MYKQITNTFLMIEPVSFGFNEETAKNNYFQYNDDFPREEIQALALAEFKAMVKLLRKKNINVITIKDEIESYTPDSIFPNNWISFHEEGVIVFFPMYAENRRQERRIDIINNINSQGFNFTELNNYASYETENRFLEGTGSMILDRQNRIAYAALSERTEQGLFEEFCRDFNFSPCAFHAYQSVAEKRLPIYHTNVMMAMAEDYVVLCLSAIDNLKERQHLVRTIQDSSKEIVRISEEQMHHFAGNMLQVRNNDGTPYLVMSKTAYQSLSTEQLKVLEKHNELIVADVPTIEKYGGGSVRCMMAEIFE